MNTVNATRGHLQLSEVSFAFSANTKPLFDHISLDFTPKQIHFLQGRNGSGKSTLFRILRGDIEASESINGIFSLDGTSCQIRAAHDFSVDYCSAIALVAQKFDYMLADRFTFSQNLQFAAMPQYPGLRALPKTATLPAFVQRFNIAPDTPVAKLSGGQRQILAILMVLERHPRVLLLDEPTAALDPVNADMVLSFLRDAVNTLDITVIIISHDRELCARYAVGHYWHLEDGVVSRVSVT